MEKIRLNYLTGYLSPHLLPLLNAVGEHPGFSLKVWYCQGDSDFRGWVHGIAPNHEHVISRRGRWTWIHPEFHYDPSVKSFLRGAPADLTIVSEYSIPTLRIAISELASKGSMWALAGERPFLWQSSSARSVLGAWMRHKPLNAACAFIGKGSWNAAIYRELRPWGVKVYSVPYYLDINRYSGTRQDGVGACYRYAGDGPEKGDFVFLFAGSLIPRKGVLVLADAFRQVAAVEPHARLVVMGDGPLRRVMAERLGAAAARSVFLGNVPYEESPLIYQAADAFVFPTQHDGWGMVVNEAMATGLPVITTTTCGAAHDLVEHGVNGWMLEPWDVEGFRDCMLQLIRKPDEAVGMGMAARHTLTLNTPAAGAEKMYRACTDILDSTTKKLNPTRVFE